MRRASAGPRWETPDPPGVAGTYGERVIRHAAKRGVKMGRWQAHTLRKVLRYDKHGDLLARIALLSTARQNGKSVIVRAFYGWLLDEGQCLPAFAGWTTLLAAAHDAKQARIIYRGVYHDSQDMGLPGRLTEYFGIKAGKLNLDTVTSEPGSSRGLSAGAIAWDEMLTQTDWDLWESLAPTQSAQRSPIMLLTSTAGHADSVVLRAFYDRLVRQASGDRSPTRRSTGRGGRPMTPMPDSIGQLSDRRTPPWETEGLASRRSPRNTVYYRLTPGGVNVSITSSMSPLQVRSIPVSGPLAERRLHSTDWRVRSRSGWTSSPVGTGPRSRWPGCRSGRPGRLRGLPRPSGHRGEPGHIAPDQAEIGGFPGLRLGHRVRQHHRGSAEFRRHARTRASRTRRSSGATS